MGAAFVFVSRCANRLEAACVVKDVGTGGAKQTAFAQVPLAKRGSKKSPAGKLSSSSRAESCVHAVMIPMDGTFEHVYHNDCRTGVLRHYRKPCFSLDVEL